MHGHIYELVYLYSIFYITVKTTKSSWRQKEHLAGKFFVPNEIFEPSISGELQMRENGRDPLTTEPCEWEP